MLVLQYFDGYISNSHLMLCMAPTFLNACAGNNAYVERGQYLLPFDAISALKDETIQASFDQQFRAHPSMLSSLNATSPAKPSPPVPLRDGKFNLGPSCPPLKQPVPLQPLPLPSSVLIVQFDCFKGACFF